MEITTEIVEKLMGMSGADCAKYLGISLSTWCNRVRREGGKAQAIRKGGNKRQGVRQKLTTIEPNCGYKTLLEAAVKNGLTMAEIRKFYLQGTRLIADAIKLAKDFKKKRQNGKMSAFEGKDKYGATAKLRSREIPKIIPFPSEEMPVEEERIETTMAARIRLWKEPCYELGWYKDWGRCAMCERVDLTHAPGGCRGLLDYSVIRPIAGVDGRRGNGRNTGSSHLGKFFNGNREENS